MMSKRLSLSLLAVAATSLIVSAATFSLFSASTTNANNTFTAGNVGINADLTWSPTIPKYIVPGDKGGGTYTLTYTGNVDAHIGVSAAKAATSASFECDAANPGDEFIFTVTSPAGNVPLDGTTKLAADIAGNAAVKTVPITVNWELLKAAGNGCQDKVFIVDMGAAAVQSAHNPETAGDPIEWK